MGRIRRYRTAFVRNRRSRGFGIHSPFAFNFVRLVLCERLPYYSYEHIEELRRIVIKAEGGLWRHPRVISSKNAKMLFRIVNFFNPRVIMQVGTSYGVSSACMMAVSSQSRLFLYEPHLERYPIVSRIFEPYGKRVEQYTGIEEQSIAYTAELGDDEMPFVLVNDLPCDGDYEPLLDYLNRIVAGKAVVVLRNISRNPLMEKLWLELKENMPMGQTYTNEKIAIMYATPKLQREDFFLWF